MASGTLLLDSPKKRAKAYVRRPGRVRLRRGSIVPDKPATAMEYSIQQVSEMLGIPIQKLRRWDEQGVLTAARTDGGHRRYSRELIDKLAASALQAGGEKPNQELA